MVDNETNRIEAVHKYLNLDINKSKELQEIVELAGVICDKPIALITLLDEHVNWIKVSSGIVIDCAPRDTSFCQYSIQQDEVIIIPDATRDNRFDQNPLVHSEPNIRFYAGAPLQLQNGIKLGTLCLFDYKPNNLNSFQEKALAVLSRQAVTLMELEMSKQELSNKIEQIEVQNEILTRVAYMQSHDIRKPLASIMGLVNLVENNIITADEQWFEMISTSADQLDANIRAITKESMLDKDLKVSRFYRMFEEIEDYAILLLDSEGNIENWNKGAEILKGYNANSVIGKNFNIFYTREDREKNHDKWILNFAREHAVAKDEGWRVRKDGTKFWASITLTAIHNEEKAVIGFTKVTRKLDRAGL